MVNYGKGTVIIAMAHTRARTRVYIYNILSIYIIFYIIIYKIILSEKRVLTPFLAQIRRQSYNYAHAHEKAPESANFRFRYQKKRKRIRKRKSETETETEIQNAASPLQD